MELKYVVVRDEYGDEWAILFPGFLIHKEVAHVFQARGVAVSAGFYEVGKNGATVYGKSESLNLVPRQIDEALIEKTLGFEEKINEPFTCDEKRGERCGVQCSVCAEGDAQRALGKERARVNRFL